MTEIELRHTTGDALADDVLRGFIGVFETARPGTARAYYLSGGYAEGTVASTSDLDVVVVLKDGAPLDPGGRRPGWDLIRSCELLGRVLLGPSRPWDYELLEFGGRGGWYEPITGRVYVKHASHLLYGEDLRHRIPEPPHGWWADTLMTERHGNGALRSIAELRDARGRDARLVYPLGAPDPGGELLGYDAIRRRDREGQSPRTTRGLVRGVLGAANALLATRAGARIVRKQEIAPAYAATIGGAWADYVMDVDRVCRVEHGYLVPEDSAARSQVRGLCEAAADFENYFLDAYRAYAVDALERGGEIQEGGWLPTELAGWQLLRCVERRLLPADTERWPDEGIPVRGAGATQEVGAAVAYEAWIAGLLDFVLFPGDATVIDALNRLAQSDTQVVRGAAGEALAAAEALT